MIESNELVQKPQESNQNDNMFLTKVEEDNNKLLPLTNECIISRFNLKI